jgi:hypothetical protein
MSKTLQAILAAIAALAIVAGVVFYLNARAAPDMTAPAADSGKIPDADQAAYIGSSIPSCQRTAAVNPNLTSANVSATAIQAYCKCFAERSADAITLGEMQYIVSNKVLPDSFKMKTAEIATKCSAENLSLPK